MNFEGILFHMGTFNKGGTFVQMILDLEDYSTHSSIKSSCNRRSYINVLMELDIIFSIATQKEDEEVTYTSFADGYISKPLKKRFNKADLGN